MSHDELEFVEWLTRHAPSHPHVALGLGDDMGMVKLYSHRLLVASDMMLEGVHFDSQVHSYAAIGRKALACNLSDCAAMAVRPLAATVSLALPHSVPLAQAQELLQGVFDLAREFDVAVIGGDTTRWGQPLVVDVGITATPYDGVSPITRSGARAGDWLYVTGVLGGSLLGRHMSFVPRVREARLLAERLGPRLHAMIDISDGLSLDLWRIGQASGVGAELHEDALRRVVSDDARESARGDGRTALQHALSDGEDYELLLAVDGKVDAAGVAVFPVGCVVESGLALRTLDGPVQPLTPEGYVH